MQLIKSNTRPTRKASSEYFTGSVWQDPIIEAAEPARVRALKVSFEPDHEQHGTLTLLARRYIL